VADLNKKIDQDLKIIAFLHRKIGKSAMNNQNDFTEEYLKQTILNLKKDIRISSEQVAALTLSYT
jgi:hypothetical protein